MPSIPKKCQLYRNNACLVSKVCQPTSLIIALPSLANTKYRSSCLNRQHSSNMHIHHCVSMFSTGIATSHQHIILNRDAARQPTVKVITRRRQEQLARVPMLMRLLSIFSATAFCMYDSGCRGCSFDLLMPHNRTIQACTSRIDQTASSNYTAAKGSLVGSNS